MTTATRLIGVVLAAATAFALTASPAGAATKFSYSSSGVSADAAFTNAPADYNLVVGRVYTDVYISAADEAIKADGTTYKNDFVYVDAYSYKIDRRGNFVSVSSSFGEAAGDAVDFVGDARRLASASLTARVSMQTCDARGCSSAGATDVAVTWAGSGATTTYKGSYRTSDPGQFVSSGRFTGTSRNATARGTVPVLGQVSAVYATISSGSFTDRTICHAC